MMHRYIWTIENFAACTHKTGVSLDSPVFLAESLDKSKWLVNLYPRGKVTKEFISCDLRRSIDSAGPDEVECAYIIEAIDGKNNCIRKFQSVSKFEKGEGFGWEEFLERNSKMNSETCSFSDILTIRVTLKKKLPNIFTRNSCWTKIATDHFSFYWNVKNSISTSADIKPVSFSESLQFEIKLEIPTDDVEIKVVRKKGFTGSQVLISRATLLNLEDEEADSKKAVFEADDPDETDTWNFPTFLKISRITAENNLDEDYFIIKFDFDLSNGKTIESIKDSECISFYNYLKAEQEHYASLKTDLKRVFTDHAHTDVELHAGKKIIRAHRVILCARSPVFSAMFDQDMAENLSNKINISDIESDILNSLLEYMYTGSVDILAHESALKLLLAADKYQVLGLKEKCSSTLQMLVSDENVCDIVLTADLIQQASLKACAINYIKEHSRKVFKSDEWKQLAEKNLKLATEIVCEVTTLLSV